MQPLLLWRPCFCPAPTHHVSTLSKSAYLAALFPAAVAIFAGKIQESCKNIWWTNLSSARGITQKEGRGVDFQLLMFMNNIPLRLGINIYRGVMWIIWLCDPSHCGILLLQLSPRVSVAAGNKGILAVSNSRHICYILHTVITQLIQHNTNF